MKERPNKRDKHKGKQEDKKTKSAIRKVVPANTWCPCYRTKD